ncbi:efflux RND transporter periplasmic adaptor subunit [Sneathiella marina]|uniref:Efflux RND transporter periplasmic adaptor subunit n=1 Tax=Sneathiella marina TaxID=2950108 RepID=A0ABY4W246_9PROT|nr:efflux RND transporter periplasmic adaptor subunit [Sneathiella marina]USG61014.1 efflux RND transporter periplasmic adaptor subunit [Sneathiella marina]
MRFITIALKVVIPLVILLLGAGILYYLVATKPVIEPEIAGERIWPVDTLAVQHKDQSINLLLFGTLVAARDVELRSLVGGEVIDVSPNFREGGILDQGELLIAVDPFDFQASLDENQAGLLEAKSRLNELVATRKSEKTALVRDSEVLEREMRNVERSNSLSKRGNISEKALDDAKSALTRQKQTVELRQAQLDILEARIGQQQAVIDRLDVGVRRAERDLKNTELRAPFRGYLAEVNAEYGKNIDAKDKVARLIDASQLEARFLLSDSQYGLLLANTAGIIGRPVTVRWSSGETEVSYVGTVSRLSSEISFNSGGVEVYAVLEGNDNLDLLRPGAFVEIILKGNTYDDVIKVPEYSVFDDDTVYVAKEGKIEPREIVVIAKNGGDYFIRGNLSDEERLIITRFPEIGPNLRVEVR